MDNLHLQANRIIASDTDHSAENLSEDDVLLIEPLGESRGDVNLAAVRVGTSVCHSYESGATVKNIEVFVRKMHSPKAYDYSNSDIVCNLMNIISIDATTEADTNTHISSNRARVFLMKKALALFYSISYRI